MSGSALMAVSLCLVCATRVSSQTRPATAISDAILEKDSRRYLAYAPSDTAETLIANRQGYDSVHDTYVIGYHPKEELAGSQERGSDPLAEFKKLAWNSDAIVIGTPLRRVSALTVTHRFVFSDYEVRVDALLDHKTSSISVGSQIVITRPGGAVIVQGVSFRAIDTEMPLFRLGTPYIFFLHLNQDSGTYSIAATDFFLISADKVISGKSHPRFMSSPADKTDFLRDLERCIDADKRGVQ